VKTVPLCRASNRRKLYLNFQKNLVVVSSPGLTYAPAQFTEPLRRIEALHRETDFTVISQFFMLNRILLITHIAAEKSIAGSCFPRPRENVIMPFNRYLPSLIKISFAKENVLLKKQKRETLGEV